jgi:hypothetical protein
VFPCSKLGAKLGVRHFGGRASWSLFFQTPKNKKFEFSKNSEKIPECSQRISTPVHKFSS